MLIIAFSFYVCFQVGSALAPNTAAVLIFRLLGGSESSRYVLNASFSELISHLLHHSQRFVSTGRDRRSARRHLPSGDQRNGHLDIRTCFIKIFGRARDATRLSSRLSTNLTLSFFHLNPRSPLIASPSPSQVVAPFAGELPLFRVSLPSLVFDPT